MSLHGDRTLQHSYYYSNMRNMCQSDDSLNFSDMNTDIYKDHLFDATKQFISCG